MGGETSGKKDETTPPHPTARSDATPPFLSSQPRIRFRRATPRLASSESLRSRFNAWACFGEPGGTGHSLRPMSLATHPPAPQRTHCQRVTENLRIQGARFKAMSLGWDDGGLEGDMGLSEWPPVTPPEHQPRKRVRRFRQLLVNDFGEYSSHSSSLVVMKRLE